MNVWEQLHLDYGVIETILPHRCSIVDVDPKQPSFMRARQCEGGCWIIGRFNASCLVFHTEIIFPLQKVICTAEALHRLVFALISHISSILAPMPCSMQFSRITDFFNNQPAAWMGRKSQLGPGRNPSMCAAAQVVTGLPARHEAKPVAVYIGLLLYCTFTLQLCKV